MNKFFGFIAIVSIMLISAFASAEEMNYNADPLYGTKDLTSGFEPDPVEVSVDAGGDTNAEGLGDGCIGMVNASNPDVRLNFTAGDAGYPLIIQFEAPKDTTLVINGPDGEWYCNDDRAEGVENPSYKFASPDSGQYDIWVGTYEAGGTVAGTLKITEVE